MPIVICESCGTEFEAKTLRKRFCSYKCKPSSSAEARSKNKIDLDKLALRKNKWNRENPQKSYESLKKWRLNNPDKARQLNKNWEAANPSKKAEKAANSRINRRGRLNSAFVSAINRLEIFARDGFICKICGELVDTTFKSPHPLSPSIDHIVSLAKGGMHSPSNVQCAHLGCNKSKHTR